jgi:hypothetical protein
MKFLREGKGREEDMDVYQDFLFSPLQCTVTEQ